MQQIDVSALLAFKYWKKFTDYLSSKTARKYLKKQQSIS
jgi:hypothetical protein